MAFGVTEVLNAWNQLGVFSYVIPFLLIFAVVFAVLEKTGVLSSKKGDGKNVDVTHNRPLLAIISASVALLALQFDLVGEFFAVIFPRFGIGLSVFLVLIILIGFFYNGDVNKTNLRWIGWVVGIGAVIWAFANWDNWRDGYTFGSWFGEYFWALLILGIIIFVIYSAASRPRGIESGSGRGRSHEERVE